MICAKSAQATELDWKSEPTSTISVPGGLFKGDHNVCPAESRFVFNFNPSLSPNFFEVSVLQILIARKKFTLAEKLIADCSQQLAAVAGVAAMGEDSPFKMVVSKWQTSLDFMKWWLQNRREKIKQPTKDK